MQACNQPAADDAARGVAEVEGGEYDDGVPAGKAHGHRHVQLHAAAYVPAQHVLLPAADVDCDAGEQAERDDEHEEHGEQGALAAQRKARHAKGKTVVAAKGKTVVKVGQSLSYRSRACLQLRHNFPVALLLRRVDASDRLSVIRMRL